MKYEICIIKNDKVIGTKKFARKFGKDSATAFINKNLEVCSERGMSFSLHKI